MKKKILIGLACVLAVIGCLCGVYCPDSEVNNIIDETQNIVIGEIKAIDENVVVEDIIENEEESTTEVSDDVTIEDEKELEEQEVEDEGFELQGDIAYEGDRARSWNIECGEYNGLTYFSQIDSRWKNQMYSSVGNASQTIGSSGCGPTSASMVVSSIKGTVTPDVMANAFLKNGYRSANNGTYWSAYRAVADEFNIGYTETSDIQKAIELLKNNNYVICSVGNGIFTTGGHYIVLAGIEGDTLKIFDPYLYNGKFNTSTRKGKVELSGNTIYCSVSNFKKYANYKQFFCYKNDRGNNLTQGSKHLAGQKVVVNVPVGIACYSGDYALVDDGNSQFWIHKSVITSESKIYALGTICFADGTSYIVQIFNEQFWANESNLSVETTVTNTTNNTSTNSNKYSLGNYITTARLNVRAGAGTNYRVKKIYSKGTVFTAKEIKNNWARTPSGWVCLDYARKK